MIPRIKTFTGLFVNPLDVRRDDVRDEDIAHALALCNRFAGHSRLPVSVAQHSVFVSRYSDPDWRLQGLLHDASEAYLGDVTKWLKETDAMRAYREAEGRAQAAILRAYDTPETLHPSVDAADRLMVRVEGHFSFDGGLNTDIPGYPPLSGSELREFAWWRSWDWRLSERMFLAELRLLRSRQNSAKKSLSAF